MVVTHDELVFDQVMTSRQLVETLVPSTSDSASQPYVSSSCSRTLDVSDSSK